MIPESDRMLGKLVRISAADNYMFRVPYDGTIGLVVETSKFETARPTARVMYCDGRIDLWFQSDLQVINEEEA